MAVLTRGAYADPGTSLAFHTGSWRTQMPRHKHWAAPCHAACPAGEDAQAWIAHLQDNNPRAAWETIAAVNPLPAVTGRVCFHPCEDACNRQYMDESIAIHALERWLGDQALAQEWPYPTVAPAARPGRVAVVGAGPAGLSAAYHLRRRGHQVTLYEALPEAGGLLRTAIPFTRLPRAVLDAELTRLFALGIAFEPRQALGRDMALDALRQSFDAVFLGVGTEKGREWSVDGAVPSDSVSGLHMLKEWIAVGALPTPRSVAIHGGGNTAVDLARTLRRAGVPEVHLVTASGLPGPDTEPDDVLNVVPRELDQAIEEGVVFHPHRTIQRLLMRGSRLVGFEMVRLKKLRQANGRKARVPFEGTETVLHVDMVVPAIGEVVDATGLESLIGTANYVRPGNEWGQLADHPGVFVGGDMRGDRGSVAAAIGDGRKAAQAMDAWMAGDTAVAEARPIMGYDHINPHYYEPTPRAEEPTLPVAERTDTAEIEGSLERRQVNGEARRCFSCGNCMACDNCWTLCPDNAVIKTQDVARDGSHYVFDATYCKGCGICARECPVGYIEMVADS